MTELIAIYVIYRHFLVSIICSITNYPSAYEYLPHLLHYTSKYTADLAQTDKCVSVDLCERCVL